MVKDRLAELRRKVNISESDDDEGEDQTDHAHIRKGDEESGVTLTTNLKNGSVQSNIEKSPLEAFLEWVGELKKMEDDLKDDVDRVKILHNTILSSDYFQTQEKSKKKTELNDLTDTIKHKSQKIRTKLKEMEKAIEVGDTSRITIRIQTTQHSALIRNFTDVMNEYHETQTQYMNRCKDKIKLDLEISETPLTVDEVMEQENFSVFTYGLSIQTEQAKQALYQVKALRDDILKIEQCLIDLHQMFTEMAVLVQSQGETIDRIETHVAETVEYVGKGEDQLDNAYKLRKAARKKKIWIYIILTVIALLVVLILYLSA